MKRVEPISIGDALREFFEQRRANSANIEGSARDVWGEVVGQYVAAATEDVYIRDKVVYVTFSSPSVRMDVMMRRRFIITDLNSRLGANTIKSISLK